MLLFVCALRQSLRVIFLVGVNCIFLTGSISARGPKSFRTKENLIVNKKPNSRTEAGLASQPLPPMPMTEMNGAHQSEYQPQNFAQSHIDDILRENENMKVKVIPIVFSPLQDQMMQCLISRASVKQCCHVPVCLRSATLDGANRLGEGHVQSASAEVTGGS